MTGFSAATSMRATSATAPESPAGGEGMVSFGMRAVRLSASDIGSSWSTASATRTTGSMGGVIITLYARTADSANWVSDTGASSNFV